MTTHTSEILRPDGTDLASRTSARHLRNKAEKIIASGNSVTIDLRGVISMSESYADELFAVLVEQHGLGWFTNNIKLSHQAPGSNHVLLSIATAIRRRLENQDGGAIKTTIDGLIAAKNASKAKEHSFNH